MNGKRAEDWTKDDLQRLIDEKVPEDGRLEYKGDLAVSRSKQASKNEWYTNQQAVGEAACNDLATEIIAFANANGGAIILGMEKSHDKTHPNTAALISAIPACVKLADVLRLGCRDLIEPRLERLDFIGRPTEDNGSGVVLIQVGASRLRPHRHVKTRECYYRRGESSVSMTMDEIKNLVLYAVTQEQREAERYARRTTGLRMVLGNFLARRACIFSAVLTPMDDLYVPDVTVDNRIRQEPRNFKVEQIWGDGGRVDVMANFVHAEGVSWRPTLRGVQAVEIKEDYCTARQVFEDGSICFALGIERPPNENSEIATPWIVGLLANAFLTMELIRLLTNSRDVPFSLRATLTISNADALFSDFQRQFNRNFAKLTRGVLEYLPIMVRDPRSFDTVINDIDRDTWNYGNMAQFRQLRIDWTAPLQYVEKVAQTSR